MKRREFPRVSPEAVGVPSAAVERLLDQLCYGGMTEPHGLMLMRRGQVFAEGWWSPYAPGIRHGLQSHTKTYAATAVGIAYTEGILRLDERVIDIFPAQAPANPSENLRKLTVRDVLCMGCGMEEMPRPSKDWIRDFLATPVVHTPGTAYMYNSTGSTLLGAMVRQKTGLGLHDYLTPRLFDKIGIDAANLRWLTMPDGMEVGGGGLYATTEDNLRLMKLYADGGLWEGERILAADYVRLATTLQNESATEAAVNPPAKDNFVGYGFQIWMCRPEGVYRADGAMGQFTIVDPRRELLIAITENAGGMTGGVCPQQVLDWLWEFLDELPDPAVDALPPDEAAAGRLKQRLSRLALPAPGFGPYSPLREQINGRTYTIQKGRLSFGDNMALFMTGGSPPAGIRDLCFRFGSGDCVVSYTQEGTSHSLRAAMDGTRAANTLGTGAASLALASAAFTAPDELTLTLRWVETCSEDRYPFRFTGDSLRYAPPGGPFGAPDPVEGEASK